MIESEGKLEIVLGNNTGAGRIIRKEAVGYRNEVIRNEIKGMLNEGSSKVRSI